MNSYPGKVGIIQRVLPSYRLSFFDMLAQSCDGGLSLFAGQARPSESISTSQSLIFARYSEAENLHLFSGGAYLCWQRGLENWLDEWDPDCLIIEANPRYLSSRLAQKWMKRRDRPIIGWGLGAGNSSALLSRWRKNFILSFDAMIAYSDAGKASYEKLGFDPEHIYVAPNAVVSSPKGGKARKSNSHNKEKNVLFVGRLQTRKKVDLLIRACANLPESLQPNLRIVGEGPEKNSLVELARQIFPKCKFTGALFGKDLESEFEKADLFVLPGTGGLAIQQAMSFGIAIIAGEGDGTQNDLVDEENGWLLKSDDLAELTSTLKQSLSDPSALAEKGKASFLQVKNGYNLENMTKVFIRTLNQVNQ